MGHGHEEPFKVPHYSIYNDWRSYPHLAAHEKRLERLGLKDNWIRNYCFKFDPKHKMICGQWAYFFRLMRSGLFTGIGLAVAMITVEETYAYLKHGHTSWNAEH